MENQDLRIVCLECHKNAWLKEISMYFGKLSISVKCDECKSYEDISILDYINKFKELPKIEPINQEQQIFSDSDLAILKERIQKAKELIIKCQEYKKTIDESFHSFVEKEVRHCDEFITDSNLLLDFLEQLIASYEKNKADVYLGTNLSWISGFNEINPPQIIPEEGLTTSSKKINDYDKEIEKKLFFECNYDSNKASAFLSGKVNFLSIKGMVRISDIPDDIKYDHVQIKVPSPGGGKEYEGGDIKLKDGRMLLKGRYPYKIALYDPVKKTIDAESEGCEYEFSLIKEKSNGDIFVLNERNMLRIFRPKENELTLLKKLEIKVDCLILRNNMDIMYGIIDDNDWRGSIELWNLDSQNNYNDMKMITKFEKKYKLKVDLMCNETRLIVIGGDGWYVLDADNLNILWDKVTSRIDDLKGVSRIYKINEECCFVGNTTKNNIVWIRGDQINFNPCYDDYGLSPAHVIKLEENGENRFLVSGKDGYLADVVFDPSIHELKVIEAKKAADPIEIDDEYDPDFPNRYGGKSTYPFRIEKVKLFRERKLLYVTSSRDKDNKRLFKY